MSTSTESPDSKRTKVTVIIPTYNAADSLPLTLDALTNQDYRKANIKVIVVDDGSTDDTATLMESYPDMIYIKQVNAGSYSARNKGLRYANKHLKTELFAFTDADCIPDTTWISNGVSDIDSEGSGILVGRIDFILRDKPNATEMYDINFHMLQEYYVKILNCGATGNMFVRTSVFDQVGVFDDSLRSGGDMAFCKKAHEAEVAMSYGENAIIKHPTRHSFRELIKKRIRVLKGITQRYTQFKNRYAMMFIRPLSQVHHREWFRIQPQDMPRSLRIRFVILYYTTEILRTVIILRQIVIDLFQFRRAKALIDKHENAA